MKILFAMDLLDGKCVRLTKGDFDHVKVYSDDPLSLIEEMVSKGARDFHIIDLNGAKEGQPKHLQVIKRIREKTPGYIQVGGGVRSKEIIQTYKECGVDAVIIGTRAYTDPTFLASLKEYQGIVLSVDILNGKPMIMGWKRGTEMNLSDVIGLAERCGVCALLVTAIERDGTLSGPDFAIMKEIMSMTWVPIIASGGVTSVEDIQLLKSMGVQGVVLGKAIYEKKIDIKDVIKFC